ncbi:ABC transporter ATP-binding protein [Streptomyces sp. NPDC049040]|uniref:ABC transporter ATP-binding protein n=1 Tax=Streptomyces sp. NPDC049040 TaxID=3365593 RepID=UPI0037172C0F
MTATDAERDRATPAALLAALSLAWRAGPLHTVGYAVLAVLQAVVPVATAWLTKAALDVVADRSAGTSDMAGVAAGLAATGVLAVAVSLGSRYVRQELERRTGRLAQDQLFAAVEGFTGLSRFEDPRFLDRLGMAHQAAATAPSGVLAGALSVGRGLLTVLGFLGSLVVVNRWLAAALVAAALPALAAELRLSRRRAAVLWRTGPAERRELFHRQLLTSAKAAKELRLFGAGRYFRDRMNTERLASDTEKRAMDRRELVTECALGLLSALIAGGGLVWALLAAHEGRLTGGDVMLLAASVAGVQGAIAALVGELTMAHRSLLAFGHHLAVTGAGPDLPRAARPAAQPRLARGVEFRDVWFRYSPDHPWVLRGVSFTIPFGSSVALVGRNGAGKSTVVKLLCRFYDPTRGAILWDGTDLRDLDPAGLRRRIGAVFQDYMEYDLTAGENIALGEVDGAAVLAADRTRIASAARRAGVDGTVEALPRSYDTPLTRTFFGPDDGDDPAAGVVLSGGQWQRLALARALLREEDDLLILDEPSSGLDAEAEAEIHRMLRTHRAGRTSLLISHRLGSIRTADLLIVLAEGRVAERGSHQELTRQDGIYRRLFALQAEGYHSAGA